MFKELLNNLKNKNPLIHNITNYVTVNDCANILLACGALPIMADDYQEVEEITAISMGLNINIGTLNNITIPSMLLAGKKSNELGHPVLLDPVGVGASKLRTETARNLLENIKFSVIRGNVSELKILALGHGNTMGVDANILDKVTESNLEDTINFAKEFSRKTGAIIVITGAIDIVADEKHACCIYNGHPIMSKITGTGCQLSAMTIAYVAANQDNVFDAVVASVCAMGICGEMAYERMTPLDGNLTYRNYLIDAVYHLIPEKLEKGARYEIK